MSQDFGVLLGSFFSLCTKIEKIVRYGDYGAIMISLFARWSDKQHSIHHKSIERKSAKQKLSVSETTCSLSVSYIIKNIDVRI